MATVATTRPQIWASRRGWAGTPEVYFTKAIDNSRLVKVADVKRGREMTHFACALAVLFLLVMVYAWQHFSAIEYGYRIEALNSQRDNLVELNRALRLEEASLRDPRRIDTLARGMGLVTPGAGQVVRIEPSAKDPGGPVMARADVAVISTP
ncbi:MAG: cell division protein FtsL [Acidobacteriia bacterium]|nr:cell division protein FtsL [Terriglobia bacterium]